jgi:exopolysaccharide biosynthesis polyprenyl glycosylphosphotransferase
LATSETRVQEGIPEGALLGPVVRSRQRDRDFGLRRALLIADGFGLWLALALAMVIADDRANPIRESLWILLALPILALLFRTYQLYEQPVRRVEPTHLDDLGRLFHALILGTLGLWLLYKVAPARQLDFAEALAFGLIALPLIAALRAVLRAANLRIAGPERVFMVAPAEDLSLLKRKLDDHPEYEMALVGTVGRDSAEALGLPLHAEPGEIESVIASGKVDHLLVRLDADFIPRDQILELRRACHRQGLRFGCFAGAKDLLSPGVQIDYVEGIGILTSDPPVLSRTSNLLKRGMDLAISLPALILLSPLLALIAISIKLDSRGPALFRQVRVGKEGRCFKLAKFRTMVDDAERLTAELMEQSSDPNWLFLEHDPRVTRVGRVLRATSLDELPQLWNVLRGEMSLVGPRPPLPREVAQYKTRHYVRFEVAPGITGPWQVSGRNEITDFETVVELEQNYIAGWTVWRDLALLLRTVPAVLSMRGAL